MVDRSSRCGDCLRGCFSARTIAMEYELEKTLPLQEIVNDMKFSLDGSLLAIATRNKEQSNLFYHLSDWSLRPAPRSVRYRLVFGPEDTVLVAGLSVQRFKLHPSKLAKHSFSIPGHKKGVTTIALSSDGRWLMVHRYLEELELWFVGGEAPVRCYSRGWYWIEHCFFRADSLGFCFSTSEPIAGKTVEKFHQVPLTPEGIVGAELEGPMLEGLSPRSHIASTVHGLLAMPEENELVIYDWANFAPRVVKLPELPGRFGRFDFTASSDGAFLLGNLCIDTGSLREWQLAVLSLPKGELVSLLPKSKVSAGLKTIAPGAERIAFGTVDGQRSIHVWKRSASSSGAGKQ